MAIIIYHMLKEGRPYADHGAEHYEARYRDRVIRNLRHRADELGFGLIPNPMRPDPSRSGVLHGLNRRPPLVESLPACARSRYSLKHRRSRRPKYWLTIAPARANQNNQPCQSINIPKHPFDFPAVSRELAVLRKLIESFGRMC